MSQAADGYLSSGQVMALTGVTRRQLEHWVEQGYLAPLCAQRGSGTWRQWRAQDLAEIRAILAMVKGGVQLEVAAAAAARGEYLQLRPVPLAEVFPPAEARG